MATDVLLLRQSVVFASALVYWGGVLVQARRVRRQIGRSPNLRPRGAKEKLLWVGWFLVIAVWLVQPLLVRNALAGCGLGFMPALLHPFSLVVGFALIVAGYAATLWTYSVMGSAWRIGINPQEKSKLITDGPFRFVRHPIYAFQIVMLAGAFLLLPTLASLVILIIHLVCVLAKATDEESHLEKIYGQAYLDYMARTGRLFPKLKI
jgi:protein-S-isoprenylcysteine O-methyltransferase Ste14